MKRKNWKIFCINHSFYYPILETIHTTRYLRQILLSFDISKLHVVNNVLLYLFSWNRGGLFHWFRPQRLCNKHGLFSRSHGISSPALFPRCGLLLSPWLSVPLSAVGENVYRICTSFSLRAQIPELICILEIILQHIIHNFKSVFCLVSDLDKIIKITLF